MGPSGMCRPAHHPARTARNDADSLSFNALKMIDENKEKIEESKRDEIKKLAEELKDMISKDDFDLE